ncbi:MAG: hypothetical protein U9N85_13105 [Bacteroidota bacterium]|nr:hypothetical protein [Bacteroidota bacterium]
MRKQLFIISALLLSPLFMITSKGQSVLKPIHAHWMASGSNVSISNGYNSGISKPGNLTFKMYFDKSTLKNYPSDRLTFEFIWFHYYVTQKEYMDSYTVNYSSSNFTNDNKYVISSTRENIMKGWWEVRVKAKYDNKQVQLNNIKKFQIYIK